MDSADNEADPKQGQEIVGCFKDFVDSQRVTFTLTLATGCSSRDPWHLGIVRGADLKRSGVTKCYREAEWWGRASETVRGGSQRRSMTGGARRQVVEDRRKRWEGGANKVSGVLSGQAAGGDMRRRFSGKPLRNNVRNS